VSISYFLKLVAVPARQSKQGLVTCESPIDADRQQSYDYTKGKLGELTDIIIDSGARLFVSAVGVPPKAVVDKLHKAGVLYMNMIGHPKHVKKCLELGVDIICAQGGEGGGHTGDVPTMVLIPGKPIPCASRIINH
jgi:NAD(P)H-dependent flavin oxidoreductase YrpB (nitropropane dioxygenase family)